MLLQKPKQVLGRSIVTFITITLGITLSQVQPSHADDQTIFYDGFEGGDFTQNQKWTASHRDKKNPSPFGCPWANTEVWQTTEASKNGLLNIHFNSQTEKCGEVKSQEDGKDKTFLYGRFVVNMKPQNTAGSISSFFLYTGESGTDNHYEIDIEFIGGTQKLRTNYWIEGKQETEKGRHWVDIDLSEPKLGINPYSQFRRYGFEWRSNKIVWFVYNDLGVPVTLREEKVSINTRMPIFMNNWKGDNEPEGGKLFPGPYNGGDGTAQYDFVRVDK
jgi:endo-1,3-1,4-beta-glycanase ExoK